MKIKNFKLVTTLMVLFLVIPSVFAAGTKEITSSETIAMIQDINSENGFYEFNVLTDSEEINVYIDENDVDSIYNIESYAIGDYVTFDGLESIDGLAVSTNIRYITPIIASGAVHFFPAEPGFDIPELDYGFDNVLEHSFNYTYGYALFMSFNSQGLYLNADYFARGVLDVVSLEEDDFYTIAELGEFVTQYQPMKIT